MTDQRIPLIRSAGHKMATSGIRGSMRRTLILKGDGPTVRIQDPARHHSEHHPSTDSGNTRVFCRHSSDQRRPLPDAHCKTGTFRFRLLNGSQARFWHLNLYEEDRSNPGEVPITGFDANGKPILNATAGPTMYQIGTEGGFLPAVATHPNGIPCPLDLVRSDRQRRQSRRPLQSATGTGGARRPHHQLPDTVGRSYILYNDAPAPFPGGDPRNDYYTGDPDFTDRGQTYGLRAAHPHPAGKGPTPARS